MGKANGIRNQALRCEAKSTEVHIPIAGLHVGEDLPCRVLQSQNCKTVTHMKLMEYSPPLVATYKCLQLVSSKELVVLHPDARLGGIPGVQIQSHVSPPGAVWIWDTAHQGTVMEWNIITALLYCSIIVFNLPNQDDLAFNQFHAWSQ